MTERSKRDQHTHQDDVQILRELLSEQFEGPLWRRYSEELAAYGYQVMCGFMRAQTIFGRCKGIGAAIDGRPVTIGKPWTSDDIEELAIETVAVAINRFPAVLRSDGWSPEGGASLKTFFIGQCLLQFPGVYRRWLRERDSQPCEPLETCAELVDTSSYGNPSQMVELQDRLTQLLRLLPNRRVELMLRLRAQGYSNAEVGEILTTTAKAVESALHRLHRKIREHERQASLAESGGDEHERARAG